MGMEFLKKIAVSLEKKQDTIFTYPVEKQKKYVAHFPEPKDGLERGYFQYCCQMKLQGAVLHSLMNIAALPLSLFYLLKLRGESEQKARQADAVFFDDGKPFNIIPDELQGKYGKILPISSDHRQLCGEDRAFLKTIFKRYPFSWMFWLKNIIKVAQYSYAITSYAPESVISCAEYSYTAPVLTEYCHARGVKLINVMHGEKLYDMHDTFSKFDEFYVWGEAYVELLCSMRADRDQFRIALPRSMIIERPEDVTVVYDYTYYLAAESGEVLKKISDAMRVLHDNGKRISVRPHPRYTDEKIVGELFGFANIEDFRTVTIEHSLMQTGAAVSLFSTVLNQAISNSVAIVIDDISNRAHFEKLKELEYICLNREHELLSSVLSNYEN